MGLRAGRAVATRLLLLLPQPDSPAALQIAAVRGAVRGAVSTPFRLSEYADAARPVSRSRPSVSGTRRED